MSDFIASAHSVSTGTPWEQRLRLGKHTIVSDEPVARGGKDLGPAPYALVLAGLAACTAMTLQMYAERKGWTLGEVKTDLRMFRDGDIERIERKVVIEAALAADQIARLAEIAEKTPVTKTLLRAYTIETTVTTKAP